MNLLDDPAQAGLLSMGLRLLSTPGKFGQAFGQAGLGAMGDMQQAKAAQQAKQTRALQEQLLMQQLEQVKAQQAERAAATQQADQQRRGFLGSLDPNAGPAMPFDMARGLSAGMTPQELSLLAPKDKPEIDYNKMVVPGPDGQPMLNPLWVQGKKATNQPAAVINNNVGQGQKDVNWGSPPKDFVWARDEAGNIVTEPDAKTGARRPLALPIAGGKDDAERAAEAKKTALRSTVLTGQADSVLDAINQAKSLVGANTAGAGGLLASLPMTEARTLSGVLTTIKANLGFDRLQQMRDMSPTGGALGQVAVQELQGLQSTVASLDQLQKPSDLKAALAKIERHYNAWKGTLGEAPQPGAPSNAPASGASLDDLLNKYGN